MQSYVRPAFGRKSILNNLPSTSRSASWSPLNFIREKLAPGVVEKQTVEEVAAAKQAARAEGTSSVFEALPQRVVKKESISRDKEVATDHKYSTANFKMSHRKLNMLGNQISGKPIDYAILQMQFSEKRAGRRIMNMLCTAKDHAIRYKKLDPSRLVVQQAWVTKGPRPPKQIEPRGRGHHGIRIKNNAKMSVVLAYGKSVEEKKAQEFKKKLKKAVSPHYMLREDQPLRNPARAWTW